MYFQIQYKQTIGAILKHKLNTGKSQTLLGLQFECFFFVFGNILGIIQLKCYQLFLHQTIVYLCIFKNLLLVDKKIKCIKIQLSRRLIDWSQSTFALFRTACQWREWRKPFECLQVRESRDIQRNQSQSGSDEWGGKKKSQFCMCVLTQCWC